MMTDEPLGCPKTAHQVVLNEVIKILYILFFACRKEVIVILY